MKTTYTYVPRRVLYQRGAKRHWSVPGIAKNGKPILMIHRAKDPDGPSVVSRIMTIAQQEKLVRRLVDLLNAAETS